MMYCNVKSTGLPLGLFSTLVFFWKRHVILCDSRIYLIMYVVFNCQNFGERSRFLYLPYINTDSVRIREFLDWNSFRERQINIRYCFVPRLFDCIAVGLPFLMSL